MSTNILVTTVNFDTNDHGKFLPYNFIENSIWSHKHLLSTGYTSLPSTSNTRQWKIWPPRGVFFGAHRPWRSFHLQTFPCREHPSSLKRRRRSSVNWQPGAHAIGRMFDSVWSLKIRSLDLDEFLTRNYPFLIFNSRKPSVHGAGSGPSQIRLLKMRGPRISCVSFKRIAMSKGILQSYARCKDAI